MTEMLGRIQTDLIFFALVAVVLIFFFIRFHSFLFIRLFLILFIQFYLVLQIPAFLLIFYLADWILIQWFEIKGSDKNKKQLKSFILCGIQILFFGILYFYCSKYFLAGILFLSSIYSIKYLAHFIREKEKPLTFVLVFYLFFQIAFYLEVQLKSDVFDFLGYVSLLFLDLALFYFLYKKISKLKNSNESYQKKLFFFEKEYMRIFEKSTGLYVLVDLDFNILNYNKKFLKAVGMSPEELLKKNLIHFIPKIFRNKIKLLQNYLRYHNEASGEFALSNVKEGGSIDIFINAIKDNNTIFMLIQDITAVKWMQNSISIYAEQLQKEMEYSKVADHTKNVFLANISHEIRTPLTPVVGFASLLKETPLSSIQLDYVNKIEKGAEQLVKILNDLIDVSKIEAGKIEVEIERVNINKIAKEIYEKIYSLIFRKSIDFKIEISRELRETYLLLDNYRLKQVFFNLISNAAKFTDEGFISLRGYREKDQVYFEVEDTGIGISPEKINRIFEPFFQQDDNLNRKYGGTGLGLAISKSLVNLMGGEIRLLSQEGKGTMVRIIFPAFILSEKISSENNVFGDELEKNEVKTSEEIFNPRIENISQPSVLDRNKKTILLGEDDDSVCMLVDFVLSKNNIQIIRAKDGEEVLNFYEKHQAIINVVLLDINLPKIDGITLAQTLKEKNHTLKIIGFSAYYYEEIKERIAGLMDYYVKKPFKINELYDVLAEYL